jgi:hypothetical protein
MTDDKPICCDCGYRVQGTTEVQQVADVRRHAWQEHRIAFSTEEALAVLLRLELEPDERAAGLAIQSTQERGTREASRNRHRHT